MGREGPCYHCGIMYTPLWRMGPAEKPVLCNACGSRWRIRGNLDDYVPKHAIRDALTANLNTYHPVIQQKLEAKKEPQGSSDLSSSDVKFGTSSSGSSLASPYKFMPTPGFQAAWNPEHATRKKRSILQQQASSLISTLHWQLLHMQQHSEHLNTSNTEEDILICQKWKYIPDNEIGFGAMLLKPPTLP